MGAYLLESRIVKDTVMALLESSDRNSYPRHYNRNRSEVAASGQVRET